MYYNNITKVGNCSDFFFSSIKRCPCDGRTPDEQKDTESIKSLQLMDVMFTGTLRKNTSVNYGE